MNKRDAKQRPEVGVKDMDKYEFGGVEIEETLTNGYLMYVPYGIHCDIFKAMEVGLREIDNRIIKLENLRNESKGDVAENFEYAVRELKKYKEVLEKILPISNEI